MILLIDNFDSFTYNLVDYFYQLDLEVRVCRNNVPLHELRSEDYKAVIFSPGPGVPENAGNLMEILGFYHDKIPVLGICLGHQAIGKFFHGNVVKSHKPMHGKTSNITHSCDQIFDGIPATTQVVRYHSLICDKLPDELQVLAKTDEGEVMAMKHKTLPIYGLQFHPEALLTEYGLEILRNWKNINSLSN